MRRNNTIRRLRKQRDSAKASAKIANTVLLVAIGYMIGKKVTMDQSEHDAMQDILKKYLKSGL